MKKTSRWVILLLGTTALLSLLRWILKELRLLSYEKRHGHLPLHDDDFDDILDMLVTRSIKR